jgi:tetratricopeptide (TPR) repeat protein
MLQLDPLSVETHYLLGQVYEHQSQFEAALAAYRRALYLERGFVASILGMARVWQQLGRAVDARRCYSNALLQLGQLDPAMRVKGAGEATVAELTALVKNWLGTC